MTRARGLYLTATPVIFLLLLSVGARLLSAQNSPGRDAAPTPTGNINPITPADLKPADAKTQHLLEHAVSGQLAAIRKGDYADALKFSAPSFRKTMTPESFGRMLQVAFVPMLSSASVQVKPAKLQGTTAAVVPTTVVGKDGTKTLYLYLLVKDAESWTISQCQMVAPPPPYAARSISDERAI